MARIVPDAGTTTSGFYGGAGTVPVIVDGKTALATVNPYANSSSGGGGGGGGSSTPTKTPKKKGGKKRGGGKRQQPEGYNPLTAPFKTPKELRAEAARLAALSVPSEESLRTTAGQQITGISGLTDALTGTLSGLGQDVRAGLEGFKNLYSGLASGVQAAGQSAAAAAGAPTTIAAGENPTLASNIVNLAAPTLGYPAAAAVTGQRMIGGVNAALTKALLDRSGTLSADTAKYLQQLSDREYQKAVAKIAAEQNAQRLNVTDAYNQQRIGVQTEANAIRREANQIRREAALASGGGVKGVNLAKKNILSADTWVNPQPDPAGGYKWEFSYTTGAGQSPATATGYGTTREEALKNALAQGAIPQDVYSQIINQPNKGQQVGPKMVYPTRQNVVKKIVARLVNAGMGRKAAISWVNQQISSGGIDLTGLQ